MLDPDSPQTRPHEKRLALTKWHRRLARYLYLDDLIRDRRLLEVGCGEGRSAVFLAQRGAGFVLGLDTDEEAIARGEDLHKHPRLVLRSTSRSRLEVMREWLDSSFDLILIDDSALLRSDTFLDQLRPMLSEDGHVVVSVPSREVFPEDAAAVSYFDLLDRMEKRAGFRTVTMLGQSPFLATTLVPFGVEDPELVMDDSLMVQEPPEEYVALCGAIARKRPFQVIQLPSVALMPAAPAAPQVDAAARSQLAAAKEDLEEATRARSELAAEAMRLGECLAQARAQLAELSERLTQREKGDAEHRQAALLHQEQMRELRTVLEERDAYVAELEGQLKEIPALQEKLAAATSRAEAAEQTERAARQRLAEVEGLLLKSQSELAQARSQLSQAPEGTSPEERQRAEILEHRARLLEQEREALTEAQNALQQDRLMVSRGAAELEAERERLRTEAAQLQSEREDLSRAREQLDAERERLTIERQAFGVPVTVGDLPTAPHVTLTPAPSSLPPHEELARLQTRISDLEAENTKLKEKASEAERESWKYMKARSDAESQAAEVREDAARKLRDARKLASVELTRAMEEATKKAVQLREELTRTERERKDALAQIKELRLAREAANRQIEALRQEIEALRWSSAVTIPSGPAAGGGSVQEEVAQAREEGAAAVLAVRAEAERAIADERQVRQTAQEAERRANLRLEDLRATVLQLELQLAEARDNAEAEQKRVETLQEELRRRGEELAARQAEAAAELGRVQQDLKARDRALGELRSEREALSRLLSEVEREAYSRAERARELRTRMLERDREIQALRVELMDRDRRIAMLEQQVPPSEEVTRLEADLSASRARIADLETERARQDAASDEAVATALRERARAARLAESLQQASRERDEAQSRICEIEQRLLSCSEDNKRLRSELAQAEEGTRRTQADALKLSERLRQVQRSLEAAEKQAAREAEQAQRAAELGKQLDEARHELSDLRVRSLALQAELAKTRASLARQSVKEGEQEPPSSEPAQLVEAMTAQPASVPAAEAGGGQSPPTDPPTKPPLIGQHVVERVLAIGNALGLEPLHGPLPIPSEPRLAPLAPVDQAEDEAKEKS